jgi:acetyl esterase/lipase
MRFIRANAEMFGIIPDKVGCIGFSAGAHLCATITAPADMTPYEPVDDIDKQSFLSNFTALIYPAYLIDGDKSLNLAPEFQITETTAPTFTVQTQDDGIQCENAIAWFLNLKKFNRPCELHVFAEGGHGYGLLRRGFPVNDWYLAAENWFRRQK